MTTRHMVAALCLCLVGGTAAHAATYPLSDQATIIFTPNVAMKWRDTRPGNGRDMVDGNVRIQLTLDTAAYRGRPGRVYMLLPPQEGLAIQASWTTNGLLLPGKLVSGGDRVLIWSGTVEGPTLTDILTLQITTDGRRLIAAQSLEFKCEIDVS